MSATTESRQPPRYLDVVEKTWPALRRFAGLHVWLYRVSRGRLDAMPGLPGGKVLLLDHVGAKSGTKRTAPLLYFRDGDDIVIVASKGGYPKHPAWFHNVKANPDTTIQVGSEKRQVRAPRRRPRGARAPLADGAEDVPRLCGLRGAHGGPRNPHRHPRAQVARLNPLGDAPRLRGRRTRRQSHRAARGRPSCPGRRRS